MAITARELVTSWGFDIDQNGLRRMNKAVAGIKRGVAVAGVAIAALGAAAVSMAVKQAGSFEQVNVAFETMLGSSERAKKLLEEITDFARKTPFELTGLLESSKRLLAFGFEAENMIDILNTLGNITAGVGKERMPQLILALGQVRAATRLRGQELRQFTEAGVPLIEELAKVMGREEKEIAQLVSKGEVSFDLTFAALQNLTKRGGRFANLMVKQSKTLFGIFSNIKDFLEILARDIGNELLPLVKKLAQGFLDFLDANQKLIVSKATKFMQDMIQLGGALVTVMGGLFRVVNDLTRSFGGLLGILKAIGIILISPLLILEDIMAFFEGRDSLFGRLVDMAKTVLPQLGRNFVNAFQPVQGFLRNTATQLAVIWQLMTGIFNLLKSPAAAFFKSLATVQQKQSGFLGVVGGLGVATLKGAMVQAKTLLADLNATAGGQAGFLSNFTPATAPAGGRGGAAQVTVNLNQNITGSANPAETGAAAATAAKSVLQGVLRETGRDFSNSIER